MTTKNKTAALIAILLTTPATAADFKWWADGKTGGQINLTTSGGTTRTALPSNPTGAQAVRSGNTQAPTVVVQAVASLPIKAVGDTCTASGTTTANEGTAITADRTMLLTWQSHYPIKKSVRFLPDFSISIIQLGARPRPVHSCPLGPRYLIVP